MTDITDTMLRYGMDFIGDNSDTCPDCSKVIHYDDADFESQIQRHILECPEFSQRCDQQERDYHASPDIHGMIEDRLAQGLPPYEE